MRENKREITGHPWDGGEFFSATDTATIAQCLKEHPDVAMSKDSNGNIEIVSGRKIFYDFTP